MSKFIKRCLLFLGIVVILNLAYFFILLNFSPGFSKINSISKFENKEYDLLVLGNSMALDGIDADYLNQKGIKTYNLAVAGNHVATSLMMFEEYLKNNKAPKNKQFFLRPNQLLSAELTRTNLPCRNEPPRILRRLLRLRMEPR